MASFIESNPTLTISDSPLKDWVRCNHRQQRLQPGVVESATRRGRGCSPVYQSDLRRVQVFWDSGSSVASYCRRMAQGGVWGGGIEMAAVSHLKRVNVFVYQARAPLHPTSPLHCL